MDESKELEIEVSSTTLGYEGKGGALGASIALAEDLVSKELYTQAVMRNAQEFKDVTKEKIPQATFGVSVLASAINPKMMRDMIKSIDYPYSIKWGMNFLKEKIEKDITEDEEGFNGKMILAQDLAYAMLQAKTGRQQERSTIKASEYIKYDPVKIRTCIETVSIDNALRKIKEVNSKIKEKGKNVMWVIEPNMKIGDGTLSSFLNILESIQRDNPSLSFGIDLDMGGLINEEKSLLQVLDTLDSNSILPAYISLSGQEGTKDNVRTHMSLGRDIKENIELGKWLHDMQFRGKKIPGLIVETNPREGGVLDDYVEFLKKLKIYY